METSKAKSKKKVNKETLKKAFMEHLLLNGELPSSVFAFAKDLKIDETDFYAHYNSFGALERDMWNDWMLETIEVVEKDEAYLNYTVREKMLSFLYTWLDTLKPNRSYALLKMEHLKDDKQTPQFLQKLNATYKNSIEELMMEGRDTTEIAKRPFDRYYDKGFWVQLLFITRFWISDDSDSFEQTDAAIEKSVNFVFDLISKGPVDSFLDLAKFLMHSRKPY
jgi:AcrR family transcriptional regulator